MTEGFDVALEMSGKDSRRCVRSCPRWRTAAGSRCSGIQTGEVPIDFTPDRLQHAHAQGHLRPRDVRDLVPDVGPGPVRPRHLAGHHARALLPDFERGLRDRRLGRLRQGDTRLERVREGRGVRSAAEGARGRARGAEGGAALQGRARARDAAVAARRGGGDGRAAQPLCQQLPRPRRPPGHRRGRTRRARALGLRDGVRALHLRDADAAPRAGAAAVGVPRHRRHDPLQLLLRRERRPLRGAARAPKTRSSPTRSTTPRSSTGSGSARRSGCATRNGDLDELEARLEEAAGAHRRR